VTDADEAGWKDVQQEASEELDRSENHLLSFASSNVIPDRKGHLAVGQINQAMVADGHAVGVSPKVTEDFLRSTKRPLCINDPVGPVQRVTERGPGFLAGERGGTSCEVKYAGVVGVVQCSQELPTVEPCQ